MLFSTIGWLFPLRRTSWKSFQPPRSGSPARNCLNPLAPTSPLRIVASDSLGSDALFSLDAFANVALIRRHVKRGAAVFQMGDLSAAIYEIRCGFFKAANFHEMGHEQIVGFFMRGELFGLDGLGSGTYNCTATALEDSEVVVLPFALLQDGGGANQAMQRQLHQVLSREITRDYGMMQLLGSMRADARLASFLVNLSTRFARQGYSGSEFILRMTRDEIGSYLGLKVETVSRLFTEFQKRSLLKVQHKHICILDTQGLRELVAVHS